MPARPLTDLERERLEHVSGGRDFALLFPTANILKKNTFDAPPRVRDLLRGEGIHDFETQEIGPPARATYPALLGTEGRRSVASMYRPRTKRGIFRRIWFTGVDRYARPGDVLALVIDTESSSRPIHVYNLTADAMPDGPGEGSPVVPPPPRRKPARQAPPPRTAGGAQPRPDEELGRAGEKWILEFERTRLVEAGRADLADQVEWVAQTRGDGDGYDISSFEVDGTPRFIEVKTTRGGKRAAFIITANEVRASRELGDQYWLYRVFDFDGSRRLWMWAGPVDEYCDLRATEFRARPL